MKAPRTTETTETQDSNADAATAEIALVLASTGSRDATKRPVTAIANREQSVGGESGAVDLQGIGDDHRVQKLERQIRLLIESNRRLRKIATTDSLTGVFNRHQLMVRLEHEIRRNGRYCQPLSLMIIDLDDFKSINDRFGHQVGDCVLRHTGDMLADISREFDIPGRYGGEEFLLILPETDGQEAARMAERLRASIAALSLHCFGHCVRFTCSIGIAEFQPGMTSDVLLRRADQAMYRAKALGKNCVQIGRSEPGPVN